MKQYIKYHSFKPTRAVWSLIALLTVLLLRKYDSLSNPQFWAEDGKIFFAQQLIHEGSSFMISYAGYLHTIPRCIAYIAANSASYTLAPTIYNYSALAITLLVGSLLLSPRIALKSKYLYIISIALIPHHKNEIFLNITNIQWILALIPIIVALKDEPNKIYGSTLYQKAIDYVLIFMYGLTGPFCILFTPMYVAKFIRNKSTHNLWLLIITISTSAVQAWHILHEVSHQQNNLPIISISQAAQIVGQKFIGNLFFGKIIPQHINSGLLLSAYVALLVFIYKKSAKKEVFYILVYAQIALLTATLLKNIHISMDFFLPGTGARYFYIPCVTLAWSFIYINDKLSRKEAVFMRYLFVCFVFSMFNNGFHTKQADLKWKESAALIGHKDLSIRIHPSETWTINLHKAIK